MKKIKSLILFNAMLFAGLLLSSYQIKENPLSNVLWYNAPASVWFETLPLGNGRLSARVFGGVNEDRLQLNEESLWTGMPEKPYPDEVEKHYP